MVEVADVEEALGAREVTVVAVVAEAVEDGCSGSVDSRQTG